MEFMCQNIGLSAGKFCIIPKDQWPAWNIRVINSPPVLEMIIIVSQREENHSLVHRFPCAVVGKNILF